MMECVIERIVEEGLGVLTPILEDETLPALAKLQHYFNGAVKWKTARKAELLAILRIWYADENALVRQKMFTATSSTFSPAITKIVRQGVAEGVFSPAYPDQVGALLLGLMQGFGENFAMLFLEPDPGSLTFVMETVGAYTDAIERIIGAPPGSLTLVNEEVMKEWLAPEAEKNIHR
jgi:hypothetical protein